MNHQEFKIKKEKVQRISIEIKNVENKKLNKRGHDTDILLLSILYPLKIAPPLTISKVFRESQEALSATQRRKQHDAETP